MTLSTEFQVWRNVFHVAGLGASSATLRGGWSLASPKSQGTEASLLVGWVSKDCDRVLQLLPGGATFLTVPWRERALVRVIIAIHWNTSLWLFLILTWKINSVYKTVRATRQAYMLLSFKTTQSKGEGEFLSTGMFQLITEAGVWLRCHQLAATGKREPWLWGSAAATEASRPWLPSRRTEGPRPHLLAPKESHQQITCLIENTSPDLQKIQKLWETLWSNHHFLQHEWRGRNLEGETGDEGTWEPRQPVWCGLVRSWCTLLCSCWQFWLKLLILRNYCYIWRIEWVLSLFLSPNISLIHSEIIFTQLCDF